MPWTEQQDTRTAW